MRAACARGRSTRTSSAGNRPRGLLLCALVALAGCTELRWENRAVPEGQWALDRQACTATSYGEARQLYDDPFIMRDMHRSGVEGDLARLRYTQLQDRQRRHSEDAFERCMKAKGYERVARP
jgi:hypothetical protein